MKLQQTKPILALYTTCGCHLCEQAEVLLQHWATQIDVIEIANDTELLDRYGVRIPVLRRIDSGKELDWPFDTTGIEALLVG